MKEAGWCTNAPVLSCANVAFTMHDEHNVIGPIEVRFGEMIESTPACLKVLDRRGRLLTMNPRGLEMIEADSLEDVVGREIFELVHPDHLERFKALHKSVCRGEQGTLRFDVVGLKGRPRCLETWAGPYRLTTGEIAHIAITNDVTEREQAVETIDQQRHALEVASRMAALGELSAGIAHEINNPLSVIAGYAGMLRFQLESGTLDRGEIVESLAAIEETVERISSITTALRTISNEGTAEDLTPIPLSQLIADTLGLCSEKCRASGIEVEVDVSGEMMAAVNPVQFSQVLMNLLSNSIHAVEQSPEKWINICGSRNGRSVRVEFSDSGGPIDRCVAEQMMTPFYTTKERGLGTGLGLPISRGIMTSHGGDLRFEPGREATTFVLELPIHRPSC